jgi:hypothetical protein
MTGTLVEYLDDYETGFNCVHERAFDCDECMESLSKRQRADAAEITRLKAQVKDITEACDAEFEVNVRMRAVFVRIAKECSWTRDEHDPLVRVGLMALDALSISAEEVDTSPR